jgi:hypothetical protein
MGIQRVPASFMLSWRARSIDPSSPLGGFDHVHHDIFVRVEHAKFSIRSVVVVEPDFALLEYDVYVWFDNQKLVTILAVIGDGISFLHLCHRYDIRVRAIAVPHCTVFLSVPTWFTSLVPALQWILRVLSEGRCSLAACCCRKCWW